MAKEILGHIDCPTCGMAGAMRVTLDKNGEPFAFCEAGCNQQLRVGGDKRRVAQFVARYPFAAGVPETVVASKLTPVGVVTAAVVTEAKPAPVAPKVPKRSGLDEALSFLGGK